MQGWWKGAAQGDSVAAASSNARGGVGLAGLRNTSGRRRAVCLLVIAVALSVIGADSLQLFLATTERTDADVLVVEAWVPDPVLRAAAAEFNHGGYSWVLVSGVERGSKNPKGVVCSVVVSAGKRLESLGVPPSPKTSVFRSASAPPRVILENVSRDSYRLWCDRAKVSCLHAAIAQFCWCFPV